MSLLGDAVTARDTAGRLVNLTNASSSSGRAATTVNDTVLQAAVADASAEFKTKAGVTFDGTDAQHLQIAVPGVWAFLALWKGQEGAKDQMAKFVESCEDFRATGANSRIVPAAANVRNADGSQREPYFDDSRFRDLSPVPPPSDLET